MRNVFILALVIFAFILNPLYAQDEDAAALSREEKLISIDVKDMEITDVIRLIADQSGLNIVTSKNVQGKI